MKLDAMVEQHIKEMDMRINNMVHDIGVLLAQKETLMDEKSKLESMMSRHGNKE